MIELKHNLNKLKNQNEMLVQAALGAKINMHNLKQVNNQLKTQVETINHQATTLNITHVSVSMCVPSAATSINNPDALFP